MKACKECGAKLKGPGRWDEGTPRSSEDEDTCKKCRPENVEEIE